MYTKMLFRIAFYSPEPYVDSLFNLLVIFSIPDSISSILDYRFSILPWLSIIACSFSKISSKILKVVLLSIISPCPHTSFTHLVIGLVEVSLPVLLLFTYITLTHLEVLEWFYIGVLRLVNSLDPLIYHHSKIISPSLLSQWHTLE